MFLPFAVTEWRNLHSVTQYFCYFLGFRANILDNINGISTVFHHLITPFMDNLDYSNFNTSLRQPNIAYWVRSGQKLWKSKFMLHKFNIQFLMSKIVWKEGQIGNVIKRTLFFFFTEMDAQMKAWNKSNKTDIFTASSSSKNINKLNKVGIVSFNGKT